MLRAACVSLGSFQYAVQQQSFVMRLKDKIAVVIGAGQSPGEGIGNGRATVLRFAQEGAKVLAVDNRLGSAEETAAMVAQGGVGECVPFEADVTKEATLAAAIEEARRRYGRIDILHYNVGLSIAGGDAPLTEITEEAFDRICAINLRGAVMACKHVIPIMRAQGEGVIITISSLAAWEQYPYVTYKATKAAMIAFTQQVAIQNAEFGIRANVILPGLMDTPMAVDTRARASGKSRAEVAAARDAKVPLRKRMGTAWDVANAALFLASDEANFITGVALPVDGGAMVKIG
jgi:NAD(P)-dependent dehydrogenase (short-subunit alcohol dehydrogenase family)